MIDPVAFSCLQSDRTFQTRRSRTPQLTTKADIFKPRKPKKLIQQLAQAEISNINLAPKLIRQMLACLIGPRVNAAGSIFFACWKS